MRLSEVTRALALIAALLVPARAARAGEPTPEDIAEASRLYERGTEAHADGRYREAARLFIEADERVPDAAALEAALLAALETDDAVLAMNLVSRSAREPFHEALIDLSDQARRRFASRVGRIVVHCERCEATIDGEPVPRGIATIVEVGRHQVQIRVGRTDERRPVVVEPSSIVTLVPVGNAEEAVAPSAAVSPPMTPMPDATERASPGASPAWFWVGLGLTAAAGGGTIASGVDTASRRDAFEASPTPETADAGRRAQLRTNALIGVTAGLGVVTAAVGIFVVDWGDDDGPPAGAAALTLGPGGASLSLGF